MSPSSQKNSLAIIPWLVVALFLCLICILFASAPGALSFLMNNQPFGSFTATQVPEANGHPTLTAIATAPPSLPTPTLDRSKNAFGTFTDDFSNPDSGWAVEDNQSYSVGYTQQQNYTINLMVPDKYVYVTPPQNLNLPFKNATVNVEIKQGDYPASSYGVMCGFQNDGNFYAVEFRDRQYSIFRMAQGLPTILTSPEWKNANRIEYVDNLGYVHLSVTCTGSSISVEINGQSQPVVVDPANTFPGGDVAIFARSGATAKGDYYNQVLFDNFSLTVNP